MSFATILSRSQQGLDAPLVRVEVHAGGGLPAFSIVGLPETVVKESKDRVRAALANCGFELPAGHITVNLAPADLPKEGGRFDLPIAIGILVASAQLPPATVRALPSCTASCRSAASCTRSAACCRRRCRACAPAHTLIFPAGNLGEAALARHGRVLGAAHLLEVCGYARGTASHCRRGAPAAGNARAVAPDLADVRGQARARRALEIAAAGGHNLLMIGPPGSGKTHARRSACPASCPADDGGRGPRDGDRAHRSPAAASASRHWRRRPFRSPHHTASAMALVGGGARPRPGEISLAHNGVLFLDELPEFDRGVLEVLRQPLESGHIVISRAARQAEFPARFQLVAAMNPCPCGYLGDPAATLPLHARPDRGATAAASRVRCSIGSTCTWRCRGCSPDEIAQCGTVGADRPTQLDASRWRACVSWNGRDRANTRLEGGAVLERVHADAPALALLGDGDATARAVGARVSPGAARRAHHRGSRW